MPMAGSSMLSSASHLGSPFMILQMLLLKELGESIAATVVVIATICWNWSITCDATTILSSDWHMKMVF